MKIEEVWNEKKTRIGREEEPSRADKDGCDIGEGQNLLKMIYRETKSDCGKKRKIVN